MAEFGKVLLFYAVYLLANTIWLSAALYVEHWKEKRRDYQTAKISEPLTRFETMNGGEATDDDEDIITRKQFTKYNTSFDSESEAAKYDYSSFDDEDEKENYTDHFSS